MPPSVVRSACTGWRPTLEVRALARLDLEALRAEWRRRYGEPSSIRSADLLRRLLAWRIQAAAYGDLNPELRRKLRRSTAIVTRPEVRPGVQLSREWRGLRHDVDVTAAGFVYAGATYASLSKVARTITGVKWNGPRFFGLRSGAGL